MASFICPGCSSAVPSGARTCPGCGTSLAATETEAALEFRSPSPLPETPFPPGHLFGGRFLIVERIGAGGMGLVYKAIDTTLNSEVALKLIHPALALIPSFVERFRREAKLARQITDPTVCRVHDIGDAEGSLYLSMEWIEGESLQQLLRQAGRLEERRALEIAAKIALALKAAHEQGIVHRDLKPGNVMIDAAGNVRVVDFGLAVGPGSEEITQAGILVGSPYYMAPEQKRMERLDHRVDFYALGLILHEMLTGARFDASPGSLQRLRSSVSHAIAPLLERLLAEDRERRFASAAEVHDAIREALKDPAIARGAPTRRAWWPTVAVACATLVLVVVAWRWFGPASKESAPPKPAAAPAIDTRALGYYNRALHLLRDEGNPTSMDEAIQNLNRALRISPDWVLAWATLGEAFWLKFWGDPQPTYREEAEAAVAKAYALGPELAEVLVARGLGLLRTGDYRAAEADLEKAAETKPELGIAWAYLGLARGKLEEYVDGLAALRKALELEPLNYKFRTYLGMFHEMFQEYDEALEAHRKATELDPGAFSAWNNLGALLMYRSRFEEAIPVLEHALAIDERGAVRSNLGTAYYFRGRYADAVQEYQRAAALEPEDARHWGNLGDALVAQEKREAARDAYRKAAACARVQAEQSRDPARIMSWATYCARAEDATCAVTRAQAALAMRPEDASLLLDNAVVHRILGQDAESLAWLEKAVLKGVSKAQIELVPEFAQLSGDPRYQRILGLAK